MSTEQGTTQIELKLCGASPPTHSAPSFRINTRLWNERVEDLIEISVLAGPKPSDKPSPTTLANPLSESSVSHRPALRAKVLGTSRTVKTYFAVGKLGGTTVEELGGERPQIVTRFHCPEVSLKRLTKGRGEGLFNLVRQFSSIDDEADDFPYLRHAGVERICGWVMEEDFPRSRGERALQEADLLERHQFLSHFVITVLSILDGKQDLIEAKRATKKTQGSASTKVVCTNIAQLGGTYYSSGPGARQTLRPSPALARQCRALAQQPVTKDLIPYFLFPLDPSSRPIALSSSSSRGAVLAKLVTELHISLLIVPPSVPILVRMLKLVSPCASVIF